MQREKVIVFDFGSQTAHLIARRIRELGVYSEIVLPEQEIDFNGVKGIVLSGGPASVYEKSAPTIEKNVLEHSLPVLGLCYGHQLLAQMLGGRVEKGKVREFGKAGLETLNRKGVFEGLGKKETVWMSHGDFVSVLPDGFKVIGKTSDCATAAIADFKKKIFGLQFHPEVTHTRNGLKILGNFVFSVCNCRKNWSMKSFLEEKISEIREKAKNKKVFLLVSGGVDSTVCLGLITRALGKERVFALHIDTGFLREKESSRIKKEIEGLGFGEINVANYGEEFFSALEGITDPEEKRHIIGDKFIEAQRRELKKHCLDSKEWILGQGTIYPDTIESRGTRHSSKIKTHHNRVAAVQKLIEKGKVLEPIAELYKDEVRELGRQLSIPERLLNRHPFPGPGLAIRVLCSLGETEELSAIDKKISVAAKKFGFYSAVLPAKSVGVQGDHRTFAYPTVLQGKLDWQNLEEASTFLTNNFRETNRVLYSVFPEKISSIVAKKAFLSIDRVDKLRKADSIVNKIVEKNNLQKKIWQFPVVLLPIEINGKGETIVLRPVESREAMTARFFPLPKKTLKEISVELLKINEIGAVLLDCTHKPPATIEWE